jgi:hypothetical protein
MCRWPQYFYFLPVYFFILYLVFCAFSSLFSCCVLFLCKQYNVLGSLSIIGVPTACMHTCHTVPLHRASCTTCTITIVHCTTAQPLLHATLQQYRCTAHLRSLLHMYHQHCVSAPPALNVPHVSQTPPSQYVPLHYPHSVYHCTAVPLHHCTIAPQAPQVPHMHHQHYTLHNPDPIYCTTCSICIITTAALATILEVFSPHIPRIPTVLYVHHVSPAPLDSIVK